MSLDVHVPTSPRDRRLVLGEPEGVLRRLNRAGLLEAADVHVAARVRTLVGEADGAVLAGIALAVRAAREGSAGLDLARALAVLAAEPADDGDAGWLPADVAEWTAALRSGPAAAAGVVTVEHGLLYLDRYHREEVQVAADLLARAATDVPTVDARRLEAGLERVFPGDTWEEQRAAVRESVGRATTVLVGGPGTGKTSTVAGLLTLLLEQSEGATRPPRIALAAPTGKAAARLRESVTASLARMPAGDRDRVGRVEAVTLHRLLGWRPDSRTRFRHDRGNPLPHDVVVVDESSMLSLTMTARLLEAVRPAARLVLVGDPDQLASVEAGAVLADLVTGFEAASPGGTSPVSRLRTAHRFGADIGRLAQAVRDGDPDATMAALRDARPAGGVELLEVADPRAAEEALRARLLRHALALRQPAIAGDLAGALTALGRHRLLCAHRDGPWGVSSWNARAEHWLAEAVGFGGRQYAGRPLLIGSNDYRLGLSNGDTGVIALREDGRLVAAFGDAAHPVVHGATAVAEAESAHALTIHKSQGSQAEHITVLLPDPESRLLTRELLYTAVTRAQERVTVVGSEAAIRHAVATRTARASGLWHRLGTGDDA